VPVFVFGSNTAGRHGKGAALFAREQRGAIYGQGEGLQGNSYAIPTKGQRPDRSLYPLPIEEIRVGVARFLSFAASRPDLQFEVTPIGCGLSGYAPADIAPLFRGSPANCMLPPDFLTASAEVGSARLVPALRFPPRSPQKSARI